MGAILALGVGCHGPSEPPSDVAPKHTPRPGTSNSVETEQNTQSNETDQKARVATIEYDGPCPKGMNLVKGGTFTDKQWKSLSERFSEWALRREVNDFCLSVLETTNAEFQECIVAGVCNEGSDYLVHPVGKRPCTGSTPCQPPLANKPVTGLTETGADTYCKFRGGRVPTVAEWFWAAMGGTEDRRFPWGDDPPNATRLNVCDEQCLEYQCDDGDGGLDPACSKNMSRNLWVSEDDGYWDDAPVGSFPAGAGRWGQLDLFGNIGDIVADGGSRPACGGSNHTTKEEDLNLSKHRCETAAKGIRCAANPR